MVWDYDAGAMTYDTVNGVKNQHGGNFDGSGMAFAGDMAFTMSGYNGASRPFQAPFQAERHRVAPPRFSV
jgi:hypothetical protein